MSNAEKQALGITLAGKNQFEVFSAELENFAQTQAAVATAENSSGSAMQENARYMESLQAKVQTLKAQFQELVLGDGGLSNFIKILLDTGTAILKFANSDLGQFIIKTVLLTASLRGLTLILPIIGKFISGALLNGVVSLIKMFVPLIQTITGVTTATQGLSAALAVLNINPIMLAITAISALAIGIVSLANKSKKSFSEITNDLQNTEAQIESTTNSIKELNNKKDAEGLLDVEKEKLDTYNAQLDALKEKRRLEQAEQAESFMKEYGTSDLFGKADRVGVQGSQTTNWGRNNFASSTFDKVVSGKGSRQDRQDIADWYEQVTKLDRNYIETLAKESDAWANTLSNMKKYEKWLNQTNTEKEKSVKTTDTLESATKKLINATEKHNQEIFNSLNSSKDLIQAYQLLSSGADLTVQQYYKLIAAYPSLAQYATQTANGYRIQTSAVQNLIGATSGLSRASVQEAITSTKAAIQAAQNDLKAIKTRIRGRKLLADAMESIGEKAAKNVKIVSLQAQLSQLEATLQSLPTSVQNYSTAVGGSSGSGGSVKATNNAADATSKLNDELSKLENKYNAASDYMVDSIDKAIDQLQAQKDAIGDSNDELQEQLELEQALKNLEESRRKKVLVYSNGGFRYTSDVDAVSDAQKQYNELLRNKQQKDQEKAIDKQIEQLEQYKNEWQNIVDVYGDLENRLQAGQLLGIKAEGDNWKTRLTQAKEYAQKYASAMKAIGGTVTNFSDTQWNELVGSTNSNNTLSNLTLADMASTSSIVSGLSGITNSSIGSIGGKSTIISIQNVNLPNVSDGNEFVEALICKFGNIAAQTSGG